MNQLCYVLGLSGNIVSIAYGQYAMKQKQRQEQRQELTGRNRNKNRSRNKNRNRNISASLRFDRIRLVYSVPSQKNSNANDCPVSRVLEAVDFRAASAASASALPLPHFRFRTLAYALPLRASAPALPLSRFRFH